MKTREIENKINKINELYNNTSDEITKSKLEHEFNELQTRLTINDYLIYGYGLKTFLENNYNYAKNIKLDRLKTLWNEQSQTLGGLM